MRDDDVWDLCPLNKDIKVASAFVHISKYVLSEDSKILIKSKTGHHIYII